MPSDDKYTVTLAGAQVDDALMQMNQRIPEGWAAGTRDGVAVSSTSQFYHNNAKYLATQAKSWAQGGTGERSGEDTNNAQYWAQQAQAAAGGGVSSFKGRTGAVQPQSGDYTAAMVGAMPAGTTIPTRMSQLVDDIGILSQTVLDDFRVTAGQTVGVAGTRSTAEGSDVNASGHSAHAEGDRTTASGDISHAEGRGTTASGKQAHAEGHASIASGENSHAEGHHAEASGRNAHAEGEETIAAGRSQHVFGENNIVDQPSREGRRAVYVEIVGNGGSPDDRSNARTLDWNGNEVLAGKLTVGAGPTANMDVATKKYVDDAIAAAIAALQNS